MTNTWVLQGTSNTTIGVDDSIAFFGGTFGQSILLGEYNDSTHVRSSGGTDSSDGNSPKNSKYIASSTVDVGSGTVNLNTVSNANCPLKISVSDSSSITVTDVEMFAFDGTTESAAPTDMTVYLAEQGDSSWTEAHGSGSALSLSDSSTPATSHDFYVLASVSHDAIGVKADNEFKFEFTYQ